MTIQKLYDSGRFPHAILLLNGDYHPVLDLYKCNPADTVHVKDAMPDGSYKVIPLREIVNSGNLRPQFGDLRVFVFADFDSMSEICQNALLKFIEEPHEFNRFVMTADSTAKILPTVLSRVVVVNADGGTPGASCPTEYAEIAKTVVSALVEQVLVKQ